MLYIYNPQRIRYIIQWSLYKDIRIWEKFGFCPFYKNNPVFCPTSQTNQGNAPILKLNYLKIELSPIVTFLRSL